MKMTTLCQMQRELLCPAVMSLYILFGKLEKISPLAERALGVLLCALEIRLMNYKLNFDTRINDPQDILEIEKELGFVLPKQHYVIGYHHDDGYMIAALTKYTSNMDVEVNGMAKGKWFHPDIYADLFNYIFNTLNCKRASFVVEKDNHKCISLLEKGGCVRECELRGIDRYLYSMLKEDYYG